jgi:hypothetical protein
VETSAGKGIVCAWKATGLFLGLLRELLVLAPAVVVVYLALFQEGPWGWLLRAQLWAFDECHRFLTMLLCLVPILLATAAIHHGLRSVGWTHRPVLERLWFRALGWCFECQPIWLGMARFAGMVVLMMGLCFYLPIRFAGPRTEVSAAELEAGAKPSSRWLVVSGRELPGAVIAPEGYRGQEAVCFVSDDWKPGNPVAVVVIRYVPNAAVEGTASLFGVPGVVRWSLEKNGVNVSDSAVYIYDETTRENEAVSPVFVMIGGGILAFTVVVSVIRWATTPRTARLVAVAQPAVLEESPMIGKYDIESGTDKRPAPDSFTPPAPST